MRWLTKLAGVTLAAAVSLPATPAAAAEPYGLWAMSPSGTTVPSAVSTENLTLYGQWRTADGAVGEALEFHDMATGYGVAWGSEGDNPRTDDFAMGVTFTSDPIPEGVGYSGNVMQKGLTNKQGQVKISLDPANGGTTSCRVKGTKGYKLLRSRVIVDDGLFHTAVCWREGFTIGLTVDSVVKSVAFDPGSVETTQPVRVGNKLATADWTDQHFGKNDCSVWVIGVGAQQLASSMTPC